MHLLTLQMVSLPVPLRVPPWCLKSEALTAMLLLFPAVAGNKCPWAATVQTFNFCTSRPDVSQCTVIWIMDNMDNMSKNKLSTSVVHVFCESKLRSVGRSSMHPCQGNCVAIGRAVVYTPGLPWYFVQESNVGTVTMLLLFPAVAGNNCPWAAMW